MPGFLQALTVADPLERFRLDYAPLMLRYLAQRDEAGLGSAYELGREALRQSVGLLDVVQVHHELFLDVLATVRDPEEAHSLAVAASALLMDLIAAFEMSQRAAMESRTPPGGDPLPGGGPEREASA